MRLNSLGDFKRLEAILRNTLGSSSRTIIIPAGTCGRASGADDLVRAVREEILRNGLGEQLGVRVTGCHGFCEIEPSLLIKPEGTFYPRVKGPDAGRIVEAAARGEVV